jgi:hypothetical protein
LPD